jgi:hypothetical protein
MLENSDIQEIINIKKVLENLIKEQDDAHLKNALEQLNQFIIENCRHDYVDDFIDIDPDLTMRITYCTKCMMTKS